MAGKRNLLHHPLAVPLSTLCSHSKEPERSTAEGRREESVLSPLENQGKLLGWLFCSVRHCLVRKENSIFSACSIEEEWGCPVLHRPAHGLPTGFTSKNQPHQCGLGPSCTWLVHLLMERVPGSHPDGCWRCANTECPFLECPACSKLS